MKIKYLVIFSVMTLLFTRLVYAVAGWTDDVTVAELIPTASHFYEVRLPVKQNPSGCKNKTGFYQDYNAPGADKMFATLLEGIKSGMRIRVFVSGNCNLNGYSEITSVSIMP